MAFKYDQLNLEILDSAKEIFKKPATQWSDEETKKACLISAALSMVIAYSPFAKKESNNEKTV